MDCIKEYVEGVDAELAQSIYSELNRERTKIELIASERLCFPSSYGCSGQRL